VETWIGEEPDTPWRRRIAQRLRTWLVELLKGDGNDPPRHGE